MNESAREIFYLLSFSVGTGFMLSKTLFALFKEWQNENRLGKTRNRRLRP
ncbi:MAG TPA: hypothetical protein PLM07_12710 [Candidatus Rifleibacterium sp.]|nr:hypothetical protein [Candidatus Rifleibacterium sp.]HPT46751.1 hypothetical protein [Candidatus Rifleibacterium sp.]